MTNLLDEFVSFTSWVRGFRDRTQKTRPDVFSCLFLAAKYTAFLDRGDHDYYGSHDLEDFTTVIDGREGIVRETDRAPLGLRQFVINSVRQLLSNSKYHDALPGYLPPEEEGRIRLLRTKLEGIANLVWCGK